MESVERAVEVFLREEKQRSLLLRGQWGCGKTHLVKSALDRHSGSVKSQLFALVSLYDKETKSQIDADIAAQCFNGAHVAKRTRKSVVGLTELFGGEKAAGLISIAARQLIAGGIVCLDDIERRPTSLPLETVLGYADTLMNAHGCKIVCIVNDDRLDEADRNLLQERSEKTFERNIKLVPTFARVAELSVADEGDHANKIRELIKSLEVSNIRIGQDINRRCQEVCSVLGDLDANILEERLKSVVVITAAHHRMENFPDIEFVRSNMQGVFGPNENEPPEAQAWRRRLRAFGYNATDDLDTYIISQIENGYFDFAELRSKVQDRYRNGEDRVSNYEKAWRRYHDTLDADTEDFCDLMYEGATEGVLQISPLNMNYTVRLLRRLGKPELANNLTNSYVAAHRDQEATFFDISSDVFMRGEDVDAYFGTQMEARYQAAIRSRDPSAILRRAEADKYLDHVDIVRLSQLTEEEFRAAATPLLNSNISNAIEACLNCRNHDVAGSPGAVVREMCLSLLRSLAGESAMNRIRIAHKYPEATVAVAPEAH